jgi:predicted permease
MQDLRFAIRSLRATPIVTAVAVVSLALGVGANTAIFSIVNGLLLRPLPVKDPDRLALMTGGIPTYPLIPQLPGYTAPISTALHDRASDFDGSCAWAPIRLDLAARGEIQPADGVLASGDFFKTLGVSAVIGRTLAAEDDVPGASPVAVISYGLWQRRFGAAFDAVGKPLTIERVPFVVVGVTPAEFYGPELGRGFDVAIPIAAAVQIGRRNMLDAWVFRNMVRLKANQSLEAATVVLRRLQPEIRDAAAPQAASSNLDFLKSPLAFVPAASGISPLRRRYAQPLTILVGLVALVLLIACANLAAVMLARAGARRHDLSVQRALGASGQRLALQLLTESLVLSGLGTAIGVLVASWGAGWLTSRLSTSVTPVVLNLSADWRVVLFTATVCVLTTLAFGLAPAIRAARVDPIEAFHQYGRSRAIGPWTAVLAIGQIGVALVLVVAASMFVRSFARLTTRPTGFDTDRVLLVNINTTHANLERMARLPLFVRAIDAIRALPGVSAVGGSSITPLDGISTIGFVNLNGPPPTLDPERAVATNVVSPGWLAAYGIRVLDGRDFNADDVTRARRVTIVNEAFVRRFVPSGNAIGGQVFFNGEDRPATIIGVASDALYSSIREPIPPTAYGHLAWRRSR